MAMAPHEQAALAEALACIERHAEGMAADAGFDGGEFSGPAHARSQAAQLASIATLHGLTADRLDDLIMAWCNTPDACPGCGCQPGDGLTGGCTHPDGCGYWRRVQEGY
jgi:hypothetical protein